VPPKVLLTPASWTSAFKRRVGQASGLRR
jgi:hypothetical protein